jgi:hypothetical protein
VCREQANPSQGRSALGRPQARWYLVLGRWTTRPRRAWHRARLAREREHTTSLGDNAPIGPVPPPANGLQNLYQSLQTTKHQCTKLEEEYVRLKLGDRGSVHHIHPVVDFPVSGFNFTPELIQQILDDACAKTIAWLSEPHAE